LSQFALHCTTKTRMGPPEDRQALGTLSPNRSPVRGRAEGPQDKEASRSPYSMTMNKLVQKPATKSATKKVLAPTKSPKGKTPSKQQQSRTGTAAGAVTTPAKTLGPAIHIHCDNITDRTSSFSETSLLSPERLSATHVQDKENNEPVLAHAHTPPPTTKAPIATLLTPSTSNRFLAKAMGSGTPFANTPPPAMSAALVQAQTQHGQGQGQGQVQEVTTTGAHSLQPEAEEPVPSEISVIYGNTKAGKRAGMSSNAYEVTFPPGPMGLELEPIIISATKQIGCRVRDFYIGMDFNKAALGELKETVQIGDVLSHLNGHSVLSLPFHEVLAQLRQLKELARVVIFKNLAAAPETSIGTFKPSPDNTPEKEDVTSSATNYPQQPGARAVTAATTGVTATTPTPAPAPADISKAKGQRASPAALMRGLVAASESPGGWKVYPGTPVHSVTKPADAVAEEEEEEGKNGSGTNTSVVVPALGIPQSLAEAQAQAREFNTQSGLTVSPNAVRALRYDGSGADDLAAYYYHAASPADGKSATGSGNTRASNNHGIASITKRALAPVAAPASAAAAAGGAAPAPDLSRVLRSLGSSIGDVLGLGGLTSIVGDKILGSAGGGAGLPAQSAEQQITGLINLKHELVTELSKTCVLLGAAEDAQGDLRAQLDASKNEHLQLRKARFLLEERVAVLQDQLSAARRTTEHASLAEIAVKETAHAAQLAAAEAVSAAQLSHLQEAFEREETSRMTWQKKHTELHTLHQELQRQCIREQDTSKRQAAEYRQEKMQLQSQMSDLMNRLESLEQERLLERSAWEAEADSMAQEQAVLRDEIKATFASAAEALAVVEGHRDALLTEVEVLRDVGSSELAVRNEEVTRLKSQLAAQLHEHHVELARTQEDAAAVLLVAQRDLADAQKLLSAQKQSGESHTAELEKQLHSAKESVQLMTARAASLEEELHAINIDLSAATTDAHANKQLVQELLLQQRADEDSMDSYRNKLQAAEDALAEQSLTYSTNSLASANEIDQLREALLEAADLTMNIQTQLDKAEADNLKTSSVLRSTLDTREHQYASTLEECQASMDSLAEDNKLLTSKIAQCEEKILVQLHETEKEELKLTERTAERDAANELAAALSLELADTQEMARSNHTASNAKLLTALAEITILETRLNEEAAQYYEMLTARDQKIDAAEDSVAALKSAEMALHTRLEEAVKEHDQSKAALEASENQITELIADAEKKEAESKAAHIALKMMISGLETQLLEACAERDAILEISDTEAQEASALILQLKSKLTELASCYDTSLADLRNVRIELADVRTMAELTATHYQTGMKTLADDLTAKFHAKVTALKEQLAQHSQECTKREDGYKLQLADAHANALVAAAQAESQFTTVTQTAKAQAEDLLKQTYTRAIDAERLLQVAYDDNQELLEQMRAAEFSEKKMQETCMQIKNSLQLHEEGALAASVQAAEALEEKKCEVQDLQFSLLQLRSEYSAVCDDALALERRLLAAEPFRKRAELLQDQLQNTMQQLTEIIHERDEIALTATDMTKAHDHVRREVQGLLASQEETMAAFDKERSGLQEDMRRAKENWQMVAEAQLAKQLQVFDKQLAESVEEYDHKLSSSTKAFVEKLELLNIKLHEKQAALVKCRAELREFKDDIIPTLNAENESLTSTCEALKAECEGLEEKCAAAAAGLRSALLQHTQEMCSATEEFASREQTLLRQRTEIMESLQQQHEHLTATIQDRDNSVETLQERVVELEMYITGQKDLRRQEKDDSKATSQAQQKQIDQLTNELANLHAQINRMLHAADLKDMKGKSASAGGPSIAASAIGDLGLTSMDLAARLEHTLAETKAMLVTSSADSKGLKAANAALVETTGQQAESLSASIQRVQELEELLAQSEDMQTQQQMLIANQQRRLKDMQATHEAVIAERCAEASAAMQHRHTAIVNELNASLKSVSASMAAAKSEALQTRQSLLNKDAELDAVRAQCALMTITATQTAQRKPLAELDLRLHGSREGSDAKGAADDIDSSLSDDHIALDLHSNHTEWHDHLITLSLDLHEALTFSILEHRRNANQPKTVPTEADTAVGKCLTAASFCTQALHSHIMRTPWSPNASEEPIPVLPAAHEMLFALGCERDTVGNGGDANDENAPTASVASKISKTSEGSVVVMEARDVPSFANELFDSQLMRRLTETMRHCNQQERALVQVNKEMQALKKISARVRTEALYPAQQQHDAPAPIPRSEDANKTSEHVFLLLEELAAHLKDPSLGNGTASAPAAGAGVEIESSVGSDELCSGGSSANNSVSYEHDRALWKSLCTVANQALQNYQTRVFVRATSESSRADRAAADLLRERELTRDPHGLAGMCEHGDSVLSSSVNSLMALSGDAVKAFKKSPSRTLAHNAQMAAKLVSQSHKSRSYSPSAHANTRDLNLEDIVALAELDASFGDNENHYQDEDFGFQAILDRDDRDEEEEEVEEEEGGVTRGRGERDMRHLHLTGHIHEGSEILLDAEHAHDESAFWNLSADNINIDVHGHGDRDIGSGSSGSATEVNSSVDSLAIEGI